MGTHLNSEATVIPSGPVDAGAVDYMETWASALVLPQMIVALDLTLVWANGAARRLLDAGHDAGLTDGRLHLRDGLRTQGFRVFLASIHDEPKAWVFYRHGGEGYFACAANA